jgi:hypothetical protein
MPAKPNCTFARRARIEAWLQAEGLAGHDIRKLFSTQTIKPVHFRKNSRAYYSVAQVAQDILHQTPPTRNAP